MGLKPIQIQPNVRQDLVTMKSMSGVTRVSLAEIYRFCETPKQCSFQWQHKSSFLGCNYNMNWGRNKNAGESAKCLLNVACSSLKALKAPILFTESLNTVVWWFCSVLLSSSATFMSCAFTERKIKATFIWWFKYRDTQRHVWQVVIPQWNHSFGNIWEKWKAALLF